MLVENIRRNLSGLKVQVSRVESGIAVKYPDSLKNSEIITYEFGAAKSDDEYAMSKEFFDWFESLPPYHHIKNSTPITKDEIKCVEAFYNKYLTPYFPDLYLDEVDGEALEKFVAALKAAKTTYKTSKNLIGNIHTFLRWCMFKKYHHGFASALEWKIGKHGSSYLLPDNDDELYEKPLSISWR